MDKNQERILKLEIDAALGDNKKEIFDNHIKPFIEIKRNAIFATFTELRAQDVESMQMLRLQLTAIESLEMYFREYIDTGKVAKFELEKLNANQ